MQISTKARYAVMALVDMVHIQEEEGTQDPVKLDKISRRQNISLSYLEQLFMALRRGNVVKSVRGPGGGYVLSRSLEDINLMDIIQAVQEPLKFSRCNGMGWVKKGSGCMEKGKPCNTHELWTSLGKHIDAFLKSTSLKAVLVEETHKFLSDEDSQWMAEHKQKHHERVPR